MYGKMHTLHIHAKIGVRMQNIHVSTHSVGYYIYKYRMGKAVLLLECSRGVEIYNIGIMTDKHIEII